MEAQRETHEFQAEVTELLGLMVHSLYSNKDIFLRELVSNASDALDKLRFEQVTRPELHSDRPLEISIDTDAAERTITVHDNGIGMSREEVVRNIGTIAKSGTRELREKLAAAKTAGAVPELIGQFGVGFYASFMVADEVSLVTRRAGEEGATKWVSKGDGRYTIEPASRGTSGTSVTLKLKTVDDDNGLHDYTKEGVLRGIIKRYSDFVAYPIKMSVWRTSDKEKVPVREEITLNSMKAIWARPKSEVTAEEYQEFYRHVSHDWTPPLRHLTVKMEGSFEASALLYIPARAPFDLFQAEMKRGVQLYVKRVFIMDECKDLMPSWLRFVKGVVDAQDLPLNVSREILQKSRQIQAIRKQLTKRVLDTLEELKTESADSYATFWKELGPVLKEGLVPAEVSEKDKILGLLMVASTHDGSGPVSGGMNPPAGAIAPLATKQTSLADYVSRMKEGQDAIYYLTGPNLETLRSSPHLEVFKAKGYEVLLFADGIDEVWLERDPEFSGRPFKSVGKGDVELGTDEEKQNAERAQAAKEVELKDVLNAIRVFLQEDVKEVRLSKRLTSSAACLVSEEGDISPQMAKMMAAMGQPVPKVKRIFELNGAHAVVEKMQKLFTADPKHPLLKDYAQLLYGQSILAEGGQIDDPTAFNQALLSVMVSGPAS